mmetsp:Transcript_4228/g.6450  ORF Transcript_4228/g.6450 Transcript_4228/m.6450 type:complete len:90 (+) Transcript_4228:474-743(+)
MFDLTAVSATEATVISVNSQFEKKQDRITTSKKPKTNRQAAAAKQKPHYLLPLLEKAKIHAITLFHHSLLNLLHSLITIHFVGTTKVFT